MSEPSIFDSPDAPIVPYPGLRPFRDDENHLFFGRDAQIAELLSRLREHRFVAVLGASGSGKSSLVRAGLVPSLHGGGVPGVGSSWEVVVQRPGGDPFRHLASALCEAGLYEADADGILPHLGATLSRSRRGLVEAVRQSSIEPGTSFLLIVDQFEELFRFGQRDERSLAVAAEFVDRLITASEDDALPIFVLTTMRADFLGECSQFHRLAEAVSVGKYLIPQMERDQLREAIEGPARVAGARIAPRLAQRLLNEIGDDSDQLPVLQHALMRTWSHRRSTRLPLAESGARLTESGTLNDASDLVDLEDFEATGGFDQALSRHADEIYESLPTDRHRLLARRIFMSLTVRGPDGRGVRRPTRVDALTRIVGAEHEDVATVVDAYRASGVTFLMPERHVELSTASVVDLSHESLMRIWRRLRDWVETESQSASVFRRLSESADLWKRGRAGLYQDPDLRIARSWYDDSAPNAAWAEQYGGGFETAVEFLERSREAADADARRVEEERQRELEEAERLAATRSKAARTILLFASSLAAGLLLAIVLAVWTFHLSGEAAEATDRVQELLDASRRGEGGAYLQRARLLAEDRNFFHAKLFAARAIGFEDLGRDGRDESFREDYPVWIERESPERDAVTRTLRELPDTLRLWRSPACRHHPERITGLVTLPDGERLVSVDASGIVRVWQIVSGKLLREFRAHEQSFRAIAVRPDGLRLATGSRDRKLKIWDTATWSEVRTIEHPDEVKRIAYSPDGAWLASATESGEIRVRTVGDFKTVKTFESLPRAHALEFHPAGGHLLFASWDGVHIIDLQRDKVIRGVSGELQGITAGFSPDGRWLGVAEEIDKDRESTTIGLFRLELSRGELVPTEVARQTVESGISSVGFSPASDLLVCMSGHPRLRVPELLRYRVGNLEALPPISVASEEADPVFSADGSSVFLADSAIRSFRVSDGTPEQRIDSHPPRAVSDVAFHPDGRSFASAGRDGEIRIWETATGRTVRVLSCAGERVEDVEYSPDGRWLAARTGAILERLPKTSAFTIRLWSTASGEELGTHRAKLGAGMGFDPGGRHLIWSDGAIRVWELGDDPGADSGEVVTLEKMRPSGLIRIAPDGETIAFPGEDGKILEIWNWREQRLVKRLVGHREEIRRIEFDPRGRYVASAGRYHGEFLLWDLSTDLVAERMSRKSFFADTVFTFSSAGDRLVATTADGELIVHDVRRDRIDPLVQSAVFRRGDTWDPTSSLQMGPDGRLLLRAGHRLELLHFGQGRELARFSSADGGFSAQPESACLGTDGKTVYLTSEAGDVRLHDLATGAASAPLSRREDEVIAVHASPDGTRLYSATRNQLELWRLDGDEPRLASTLRSESADGREARFRGLDLSADGRLLAIGETERRVQILSGSDLRPLSRIDGLRGLPRFHPNRPELACVDWRALRVFDVSDPSSPRERYRIPTAEPQRLEYSPDGSRLILAVREGIVLRDAATGAHVKTLPAGQAQSVAMSPDGRWIVSGGENSVTLWDAGSGERVGAFGGHPGVVTFVSFTTDGERFVSRDEETVCVWDLEDLLKIPVDYAQQLEDLDWSDADISDRPPGTYVSSNLKESVVSPMRPGPANALPRILRREVDPEARSRDLFWRYLRAGSAVSARYLLGELRGLTSEADVTREQAALIDLYLGRAQSEKASLAFRRLQVRFALELDPESARAREAQAQLAGE